MTDFSNGKHRARSSSLSVYLPFILAIVLALGVFIGYMISVNSVNKSFLLEASQPNKLYDILNYVEINYVDSVDQKELNESAIHALLSELDPHSFYIPARDIQSVTEDLEGNFEGIGIEFFIVDDTITVVTPISGGPSEALGIQAGDKIIFIDDSLVAGIGVTNQMVADMLRGPKGSEVQVEIARVGYEDYIPYMIKRDKIPLYSVDVHYMIDDEIGYIKVNRFSQTTYEEFSKAVYELNEEGLEKLIIDFRQNPGGYLSAAVSMVDELLSGKKLIVYTEGRAYERTEYYTSKPGFFEEGELVILIDEGSASASEIVAGAVQDWDRGIVMGRRSYGKGLVQEQFVLEDQSALRLTVARYYTPSGRSIQKSYNNGAEAYHMEIYDRYDNGEYLTGDSISVSDSTKYYTLVDRRVVYGGGGIIPDVFIPLDTVQNNYFLNSLRRYVPEFMYGYYASHIRDFEAYTTPWEFNDAYSMSASTLTMFLEFAQSKGYQADLENERKYKEQLEVLLKAFVAKQKWGNEGYYIVMNTTDYTLGQAIDKIRDM